MFRHYCVIHRELVLPYQVTEVFQMQLSVIQFKIISHMFYVVQTAVIKIFKILKLSYL
jgi:hypothetical protein